MYKLAETFIKKESQWQAPLAAVPPLAVGLGATGLAIGAGLTYNTLKNNPTDFKKWQAIPAATAAATGVVAKNAYDWTKGAINSIGNFVNPTKPTISNTLKNQPGLLNSPKSLNWTNTASADNTSSSKAIVKNDDFGQQSGSNFQNKDEGPKTKWTDPLKKFGKRAGMAIGAGTGLVGIHGINNLIEVKKDTEDAAIKSKKDIDDVNAANSRIRALRKLPQAEQDHIRDSIRVTQGKKPYDSTYKPRGIK